MLCPYGLLCRYRNCFGNFTINRDGGIGTNQCANSTPRASVFERVRGVVALRGKPRHVQFHHFLWTCTEAQLATFTVSITDFDPTFCRHWRSFCSLRRARSLTPVDALENESYTCMRVVGYYLAGLPHPYYPCVGCGRVVPCVMLAMIQISFLRKGII